jgi:hypothetical protein
VKRLHPPPAPRFGDNGRRGERRPIRHASATRRPRTCPRFRAGPTSSSTRTSC